MRTALRATDFANFTTHGPARSATTALLLYDDKNLYVGFICDQRGEPLTATQTVNDVGYGLDDEVTVAIDTSGNGSRTYTFTSTPLGVRYESSSESSRYQPPWSTVAATVSTTRSFHRGYSVTAEYGGTLEHAFAGVSASQWLRRLAVTRVLGNDSELALSLREISGTGGFAPAGEDLAVSYHRRFRNQSQLYVEYGSPASYTTVQRFIIKYVYHLGAGGAGT
ncbi:MAG: hypothetical protein GIX03_13995 [Candidatus Eremiobacteraeota bacterium]|nr:hypothetical protein [Candidatus Eremiobacteraeota bacterium]MBC5804079.1 hypothetical protein [Candidatus Eremiobacteraeota bacterium]MBC5821983.1 hypothetical protein [Candidatus Eremiobacteraeota bacterium]